MCQAIQKMRMESEQIGEQRGEKRDEKRGEQRGALKEAQKNARGLYKIGLDVEKIPEGLGYDVDTVRMWLNMPSISDNIL